MSTPHGKETALITGEIRLWKMTRRQTREAFKAGEIKGAILPTGSTEQHNEHLAMEHDWLEYPATGQRVDFTVVIFFPWDPDAQLFTGERVYFDPFEAGLK